MRSIILFILFCVSISATAQYESTANKIEKIMKVVPDNEPLIFWKALRNKHPDYQKLLKATKDNKESLNEALSLIPSMAGIKESVEKKSINTIKTKSILRMIEDTTKANAAYSSIDFYFVSNNEPNAGMYPEGTCEINSYWLNSNRPLEELFAIVLHETAHYVMMHRVQETWKTVKAVRRNSVLAEIGTVVAMGAYAGSQIYAAQNGVAHSNEAQQQIYNQIAKAGGDALYEGIWYANNRQKFTYSREHEAEADIIAFWFMEKNGIDPIHLIHVMEELEKISPSPILTRTQRKVLNHPEISVRISYLKKLYKLHHNPNFVSRPALDLSTYMKMFKDEANNINDKKTIEKNQPVIKSSEKSHKGQISSANKPHMVYVDKNGQVHSNSLCSQIPMMESESKSITSISDYRVLCPYCFNVRERDELKEIIESNQFMNSMSITKKK